MLDSIALFRGTGEKMNWLSQRQRVIAANISHADTPNFQPSDLKKFDFQDALRASGNLASTSSSNSRSGISTTSSQHILPKRDILNDARAKVERVTYESAPAGNGVVIEEQLIKAGDTAANHSALTNLHRKNFGMLMSVIRGNNG